MRSAPIAAFVLVLGIVPSAPLAQDLFIVDSTANDADADTSDGVCQTANGDCTLPASVQQANANFGETGIQLPEGIFDLDETLFFEGDTIVVGATRSGTRITTSQSVGLIDTGTFGDVSFRNLTLDGGVATEGGTLNNRGANVVLELVTLSGGLATSQGGCINNEVFVGSITLSGSVVRQCAAPGGGAIANFGTIWIDRSIIEENSADSIAGLFSFGGNALITQSWFRNNVAAFNAAGAAFNFNQSTEVRDSLFSDNQAGFSVALQITGGGQTIVSGNTFSQNLATTGHIIELQQNADALFNNNTLAFNDVGTGADLHVFDASVSLSNNAIQSIRVQPIEGVVESSNNNVIEVDQEGNYPAGSFDQLGIGLGLWPLADNGGPLPSVIAQPDSPLVDAGSDAPLGAVEGCEHIDAHGNPRDTGATDECDVGAVELTACIDGEDNDNDLAIDFGDDLGCDSAADLSEELECSDGLDNDDDGAVDADDPECTRGSTSEKHEPSCSCGNVGLAPLVIAWFLRRRRSARIH